MGHPIVMGRKTFESIGRVLPGRQNIILSTRRDFVVPGAYVERDLEDAVESWADKTDEIFIIGGAQIYSLAFPRIERIYLTLIHSEIEGDAFFPEFAWEDFEEISREDHPAGGSESTAAQNPVGGSEVSYSFIVLDRKKPEFPPADQKTEQ